MPIPAETHEALNSKKYTSIVLDLNKKDIIDGDIPALVVLLNENPHITTLYLEENKLTNESTKELAKLVYIKKLRIRNGNNINIDGLLALLNNHSITDFPIQGGSGKNLTKLRTHFKDNAGNPIPIPHPVQPHPNIALPNAYLTTQPKPNITVPKTILTTQLTSNIVLPKSPLAIQPKTNVALPKVTLATQPEPNIVVPKTTLNIQVKSNIALPKTTPIVPIIVNKNQNQPEDNSFLEIPVTQNAESGENDFLNLAYMLFLDLEQNSTETGALMRYLVLVFNHFQHNSTYAPQSGYGKNQAREREGKLEYFRSQNKSHPHREFISNLLRKSSATNKGKCYLPVNESLKRLLILSSVSVPANQQLQAINPHGFVKTGKSAKELGLTLAYSGLRSNNFTAYHSAIKAFTETRTSPQKNIVVQQLLKPHIKKTIPQKLKNQPPEEIKTRTKSWLNWFQQEKPPGKDLSKLHSEMFEERHKKLTDIKTALQGKNLQQINIENIDHNTCLIFKLYPSYNNKNRETANYAEGVTNVLLNFFIALLNHNARQQGLSIRTERRQSFGFIRPTVTDVGALRIRLSLGLEPSEFIEIIVKTLEQFDVILQNYDFTKSENQQDEIVKNCFSPSERSKAKDKLPTPNSGRKILTAVRSDEDKWQGILLAENCLESHNNTETNIAEAFKSYLNQFVINRISVGEDGKPVKGALNITPEEKHFEKPQLLAKSEKPTPEKSVLFKLLNNICHYTHTAMAELSLNPDINLPDELKNSYDHIIGLIFKHYNRAKALLEKFPQFEISHLYAHANNLIENLLEELIILHGLCDIQKKKNPENKNIIEEFTSNYRMHVRSCFDLTQTNLNILVTYADSGQQAIIASILAMDMQVAAGTDGGKKYLSDKSVYIHKESYFEINHFFDTVLGIKSYDKSTAKIVFIDITEINNFKIADYPHAQSVIIDVTNNNTLNQTQLRTLVKELNAAGKWVTLVESLLKHGQLGLDKYQSGRITCIAPQGKALNKNIRDELNSISSAAMEPEVARYFQMVTDITGEYTTQPLPTITAKSIEPASLAALPRMGLFKAEPPSTLKTVVQPPLIVPQRTEVTELKA